MRNHCAVRVSCIYRSKLHYHNRAWNRLGLTDFRVKIWPFLTSLAVNYEGFGLGQSG